MNACEGCRYPIDPDDYQINQGLCLECWERENSDAMGLDSDDSRPLGCGPGDSCVPYMDSGLE